MSVGQEVIVISPHNEAIRQEFGRAFARWYRNTFQAEVRVDWRDVGGSSEAFRFVQSEFVKKTNGIGVDCFFGGGLEPYTALAQKGFLQAHRIAEPDLAAVPTKLHGLELYDPEYRWYGAALSGFGILQNIEIQKRLGLPKVTRWDELANPALFGWVGAGDPRTSGSMMVMYEGILQYNGWEKGWRILTQLGGNARKFDRVSTTTAKDVTLGETAYGLAIDFYGFTQVAYAGRTNLSFVLPSDFVSIAPDPVAILRGPPHPLEARRFVDFVMSDAGQKLWFLPKGHPEGAVDNSIERMPVRADLYERYPGVGNIGSSPYQRDQPFQYNAKVARDRRDVLPTLFGALLVDTHPELQSAWRAVMARGSRPEEVAELGKPPISEADLLKLAQSGWTSNAVRWAKKVEWQTWASEKYRRLANIPLGNTGSAR